MNRIIECRLDSTYKEIYTGIWQHDYGQILRITGADLPKAVEVQFSLKDKGGDTLTRIGTTVDDATEVKVPDSFLKNENCTQNYLIYAWIYVTDDTSGNTEYQIILHVKSRPKPEEPTEEPLPEPNIFHETVEAVNDAADRAAASEQNAKASATEAGKYAASASESAVAAEKTKEDALREIGEKKQESIEAIQNQEETSVGKIINHTDDEIKRILNQTAGSKRELEQTITHADASKKELEHSIQTAGTSKTALDKSTELAGTAKTELDTSTQKAGEAKTALDGSARTAGEMQETLSATVKQAGALDTSLNEKIKTGTQLKTDLVASGEKAVQDIQNAGSEQLGKMQAVAEEFTADREQITTNKEDIGSIKEEMGKNFLDDAKTKRSLDALWKLNQGISYQFETDIEKAYQKDIPSGAKLASVKKVGGRTIVWNQLFNYKNIKTQTVEGVTFTNNGDGTYTADGTSTGIAYISNGIKFVKSHMYYMRSLTTIGASTTYKAYIIGGNIFDSAYDYGYGAIDTALKDGTGYFVPLFVSKGATVENLKIIPQIYDLTKMFGAGNEPSTPEEFEALFPEDYYEYDEGTLLSIPVNEVCNRGYSDVDISEFARKYPQNCNFSNGVLHVTKIYYKMYTEGIDATVKKGDKLTYLVKTGTITNIRLQAKFKNGKTADLHGGITSADWTRCEITLPDDVISIRINYSNGESVDIKNLCVNGKEFHKNTYPIPQAILNLDGYGDGVSDDVYNYVDWENKQYHKRVGKVDLGTLPWENYRENVNLLFITNKLNNSISRSICSKYVKKTNASVGKEDKFYYFNPSNLVVVDSSYSDANDFKVGIQGVMLYYNLAEEEIIDISDIIDNTFQEPIEVEAGGTLTFLNSNGDGYQLPIPNEEEYIVSLAEVGGGASE